MLSGARILAQTERFLDLTDGLARLGTRPELEREMTNLKVFKCFSEQPQNATIFEKTFKSGHFWAPQNDVGGRTLGGRQQDLGTLSPQITTLFWSRIQGNRPAKWVLVNRMLDRRCGARQYASRGKSAIGGSAAGS